MTNDRPPALKYHLRNRLRHSTLFAGLDDPLLDQFVAQADQERHPKGFQGDARRLRERFYVIVQGRVESVRLDPQGKKRFTLFVLGPGDGYDVVPLLDGQPHEVLLQAIDDLFLLSFPIPLVRQWLAAYPQLNRNFLAYVAHCLRNLDALATDLALHDTLKRLANLILRHAAVDLPHDGHRYPVPLIQDLKHETLASMIGTVRQVVNRHLQHLRRQGVLMQDAGGLFIKDLEVLKGLAEGWHHRSQPATETAEKTRPSPR